MSLLPLATALATAALAVLLGIAVTHLHVENGSGLSAAVQSRLDDSGVEHPVTAVLLNFRGYDTWLELVVLLLAVIGTLEGRWSPAPGPGGRDAVSDALVGTLVPLIVLVAALLLEHGSYAPGGAFQAGALLASAAVLLHLTRHVADPLSAKLQRVLLALGVGAFAIAAAAGLLIKGSLLQYGAAGAGTAILVVELAAATSIALALALLASGRLSDESAPEGP